MSNHHVIITIGRQFGSGGHEIGVKLAKKLNIPFHDKDMIDMAAEKLNISLKAAKEADEADIDRFLAYYAITPISYSSSYTADDFPPPISDRIFRAETEIIKKFAERSSCVIVGRCADDILRDEPGLISVFIAADKRDRIRRIAEKYHLSDHKASERIKKVERERSYYYERHTGKSWGDAASYQIVLNSGRLGIDKTIELLAGAYDARKAKLED